MMDESTDFEYDEDVESDESAEADESDEADEAWTVGEAEADEDVEDVEADIEDVEADEASDEMYGGEAEDVGEDVEADLEGDEAVDEAVRVRSSARVRARARRRNAAWAQKFARQERLRAVATQRSIATQAKAIQKGVQRPTRIASVGTLQGAGVVKAVLPNGRSSRMRIVPTLAPLSEMNRLRNVVMTNEKRQALATGRNAKAIARLASTQATTAKRLTQQQLNSDKDLARRMVEADNRLDKRITKELGSGAGLTGAHGKRVMRMIKRERTRSLWNSILLASSAPFFAAYGERSDPFAKNNMILTGSLLGWLLLDDVADRLSSGKSNIVKSSANVWSYIAPVGNGATAYFLLRNKQHERFVTGIDEIDATKGFEEVDLEDLIGKKSFADFKKEGHAVVATFLDGSTTSPPPIDRDLTATLKDGKLTLRVTGTITGSPKVAWMVDTRAAD